MDVGTNQKRRYCFGFDAPGHAVQSAVSMLGGNKPDDIMLADNSVQCSLQCVPCIYKPFQRLNKFPNGVNTPLRTLLRSYGVVSDVTTPLVLIKLVMSFNREELLTTITVDGATLLREIIFLFPGLSRSGSNSLCHTATVVPVDVFSIRDSCGFPINLLCHRCI